MSAGQFVVGARRRISGVWREPLARTGHVLIVNSVLNAALGVGYWLVAARFYPPGVVGLNSAAISAMMLLAGVAQLNMMSTILRFVPTSGAAAGPLISGAYLIGGVLSGLAAIGFLAGLPLWEPNLAGMLGSGLARGAFVVATVGWAVFVMQDNALVAVGRPALVPTENASFAAAKIILVVALSVAVPGMGIWLSWSASMLLCVGAVTFYLFWRALPSFTAASVPGSTQVASLRELCRFAGPDYIGAVAWIACTSLVPLLVLGLTAPGQFAAFSLAWQICLALYAVPTAFGQSLVAHGATSQDQLGKYHRQALRQSLMLLVPVVTLVVVLAPVGLGFFGDWYADHGTWTLRLLALSALPDVVVSLEVSKARVARRMTVVVAALAGLCVLVLGLTIVLVPPLGIVGGGIAWLVAQTVMAALLAGYGRVRSLRSRLVRSPDAGVPDSVVQAALASGGWQPERDLPTLSDSAVIMVNAPKTGAAVLKMATTSTGVGDLHRERKILDRLRADERLGPWRYLLPTPLAAGDPDGGSYLVIGRLPGVDGSKVPPGMVTWLTPAAFNAIAPLHRLDSTLDGVGGALLRQLVEEPAARLRAAVRRKDVVDRLAAGLTAELAGRKVRLGWTHGDFFPGNILVSGDGRVRGIIDWGQAREHDMVVLDLAFWLLTIPRAGQPHEFGARIAARLRRRQPWLPAEARLLQAHNGGEPISGRTLLLLAWLRHVTDNLAKSERYAASPLWSRRNIMPVLALITGDPDRPHPEPDL